MQAVACAFDPDMDFIRVDRDAFIACPDESVDYAVMEQTADAVVVPLDAGWNDVGSWSALWEISEKTQKGTLLSVMFLSITVQITIFARA